MLRKTTPDAGDKMTAAADKRIVGGRDFTGDVPVEELPADQAPMMPLPADATEGWVPPPARPMTALMLIDEMCARCLDGGWAPQLGDLRELREKVAALG